MPEPRLVLEQGLAELAGVRSSPAVRVVPRAAVRPRPWRRRRWARLRPDAVLAALDAAPGAPALARPAWADAGAAGLPVLARLDGRPVVLLPAAGPAAGWVCRLAAAWADDLAREPLVRRLQSAAGLAALRGRPGAAGVALPVLRPAALGRWCGLAWRPCGWCREGGGLPGAPCGRCGRLAP